jgi:ribosomal protein S18 acetylase RimI-like enzyme
MDVRDWAIDNVNDLAGMYNEQVVGRVPHCYAVSPEEFGAGRYQKTGDDYLSAFHAERVIVGIQRGQVRGFAHVTVGEIKHRERRLSGGFIHFLTYAVGHRDIGQALLVACERHFRDASASTIWAFDGYFYRFYHLGFPLVSDRMGHLYGLFGMNGYKPAGEGEIFLEYLNYPVAMPVFPDPAVEVQVQAKEGRGDLPNITVRALRDGKEIGSCIALSGGDFCHAREVQDRIFVDGLGVTGKEQGQGWGRYLLTRTLWEARQLGYRDTVISTGKRNYRAQLFYTNYGYRVTDTVYGFVKETEHPVLLHIALEDEPEEEESQ